MSDADRWATFDCYGTLVDWNGGIEGQLARLFGEAEAPALLAAYHEAESAVERARPGFSYREVLAESLERVARTHHLSLPEDERGALARSLPHWNAFSEVRASLDEARRRGWRLGVLSNTDRDFIDASIAQIGVAPDLSIVASEIGSYKPAHGHWSRFFEQTGADPERHVHVAASLYHDIAPANELGLRSIWINRLGERPSPPPTRELPDLRGLPDALDELVAA